MLHNYIRWSKLVLLTQHNRYYGTLNRRTVIVKTMFLKFLLRKIFELKIALNKQEIYNKGICIRETFCWSNKIRCYSKPQQAKCKQAVFIYYRRENNLLVCKSECFCNDTNDEGSVEKISNLQKGTELDLWKLVELKVLLQKLQKRLY